MPGWWPCPECCASTCIIGRDAFDRADNTNLGSDWKEISPQWKIDTFRLVEEGNTNARILWSAPNTESGRANVSVTIYPTNGDKFRILVNSDSGATVYQYVEVECLTGSVILTAGGESRTYTSPDGWDIEADPITFHCCLTDGILLCELTHLNFHGIVWDNTATVAWPNRGYAGLMNGGSSELTWDNFAYDQHVHDGPVNPPCDDCGCNCEYESGGQTLYHYPAWRTNLQFFCDDPDSCCYDWDGLCINLEYDAGSDAWLPVDSGTICGVAYPGGNSGNAPVVTCGGDDRCQWFMEPITCCDSNSPPSGCTAPTGGCDPQPADSMTCDPFAVRWDFNWTSSDLACGGCCTPFSDSDCEWYAILTDGVC